MYICIFWQHFFVNTNFIKHNRHFLSTYFLLNLFIFPYCFYRIRRELIYVLSIVVCIPSTFCLTLGHHQGRIYYKSDDTFVFAYYYYVRASLPLKIIVSIMFNEIYNTYIYIYIYIYERKVVRLMSRTCLGIEFGRPWVYSNTFTYIMLLPMCT